MPNIESTIDMINLILFMIFVSSIGAQAWIAFLDVVGFFTDYLNKFRPLPSQDKFSRIAIIVLGALYFAIK